MDQKQLKLLKINLKMYSCNYEENELLKDQYKLQLSDTLKNYLYQYSLKKINKILD